MGLLVACGAPVAVNGQSPGPDEPTSIAVLVENSSVSHRSFNVLTPSIQGFLKNAPTGYSYALAVYSRPLLVAFDFTKEVQRLPEIYTALGTPIWSEINTYDAVYGMLDKLGRLPGRRILVLIGSGLDTLSAHTSDEVKKKMESENVTVFAVGVGTLFHDDYRAKLGNRTQSSLLQAHSFLEALASKNGGGAWFPKSAAEVPGILDGILRRITARVGGLSQ